MWSRTDSLVCWSNIWCNNALINGVYTPVSNNFSCFCWHCKNTQTQDMKAAVFAKAAEMQLKRYGWGGGGGSWRVVGSVWSTTCGSPLFHAQLPEVRVMCQGHASAISAAKTWFLSTGNVLGCYFRFCRHHRYWVSGAESAHPCRHLSHFQRFFELQCSNERW